MNQKTEGEIVQLYARLEPYFKVPKEIIAKYSLLKRILVKAGLPVNTKDRKERDYLMLNEISHFVHPGLEYKPDEEILEATVDISKLFGGNVYLANSMRITEGYVGDVFVKQGFITMSPLSGKGNISIRGYFLFMPFNKDFNGWVTAEDIESTSFNDRLSGIFHRANKGLFDDHEFYNKYELTYDNEDTARLVLDDKVRDSIKSFAEIFPYASFSFSRSYLFIFIQLTTASNFIYYRYGNLQLLKNYIMLVEAGPMAVDIFKLNR